MHEKLCVAVRAASDPEPEYPLGPEHGACHCASLDQQVKPISSQLTSM
jgi:hypothetical protein